MIVASRSDCSIEQPGGSRICSVCGAKALGYNFGVISCESCKAFFRRNAFKDEEVTCPFSNSCTINEKSRRFCQACRLRKCYSVGMKRDWTSSMGEKRVKPKEEEIEIEVSPEKKRINDDYKPQFTSHIPRNPHEASSSSMNSIPFLTQQQLDSLKDQVTLPKDVFMQLMKQANKKSTECSCTCSCGFYPPDTQLTAKTHPTPRPPFTVPQQTQSYPEPPPPNTSIIPMLVPPAMEPIRFMDPFSPPSQNVNASPLWTPPIPWTDPILVNLSSPSNRIPSSSSSSAHYVQSPLVSMNGPPSVQSLSDVIIGTPSDKMTLSPSELKEKNDDFARNFATIGRNPAVYEKLTIHHRSLLIELLTANELLRVPVKMPFWNLKSEYTLMDAVKCVDIAVRRLVMMAKELRSFTELDNADQMALIKGAMIYDPHNRSWKHNLEQNSSGGPRIDEMVLSLDILKGSEHFGDHIKFLATFDDRIRTNEVLMVVIHVIVLFSTHRKDLKNKEAVQKAHDKYYELLFRILECEFSSSTARDMLQRIDNAIKQLRMLNGSLLEVVYGIDSSKLDPLIVEVFDLPPRTK